MLQGLVAASAQADWQFLSCTCAVCLALCVIVGLCIKTIQNAWQYVSESMNAFRYVYA